MKSTQFVPKGGNAFKSTKKAKTIKTNKLVDAEINYRSKEPDIENDSEDEMNYLAKEFGKATAGIGISLNPCWERVLSISTNTTRENSANNLRNHAAAVLPKSKGLWAAVAATSTWLAGVPAKLSLRCWKRSDISA